MRILVALLLVGCVTPAQPKLRTVYTGPYAWRNDGYSRSDRAPIPGDLNAKNAVWMREAHYEENTRYTRRPGVESLDHYLNRKPTDP